MNSVAKEAKEVDERPVSVMSSLSYRKRTSIKDSIGGKGDEETLFSTLSERPESPDRSFRKAKRNSVASGLDESSSVASWKKHTGVDNLDERSSVFSQSFSEKGSKVHKALEKRWSTSAAEFDKTSVLSAPISRSGASWCGLDARDDDARSSLSFALSSPGSLRHSTSRLDDLSPSYSHPGSLGLSQLDDAASVALSDSRSLYSQHSLSRSLSVPPRPRSSASGDLQTDDPSIRPVGHRSYLDPDLEAAINEVLSYKPVKFKRSSLDPDSDDDADRKSVRSSKSAALLETSECPASSLRRSASALDFSRPPTSKGKSRKRSSSSSSDSSSEREKKSSRKHSKKSKKKSKKKKQQRSHTDSSSDSSSSSSSGSTVSYRSNSSIKKGPRRGGLSSEGESVSATRDGHESGKSSKQRKKEEKQHKKQVDSLMMKYLYRPESD